MVGVARDGICSVRPRANHFSAAAGAQLRNTPPTLGDWCLAMWTGRDDQTGIGQHCGLFGRPGRSRNIIKPMRK